MNQKVVFLRRLSYEAKRFTASTVFGIFEASGTLCGHIDIVGPFAGTYALSPDELLDVIVMLQQARADVLEHSDPLHDPRLMEGHRESPEGVK
jgi:hypothetical protein